MTVTPYCTVPRQQLLARASRDAAAVRAAEAELHEQRRFERICARELLGEID